MTEPGSPQEEVRGPAPSVSTPVLLLVLFSVFTAYVFVTILVIPEQTTLRRLLAGITALPLLVSWFSWFRHRANEQRVFRSLVLAFLASINIRALGGLILTFDGGQTPATPSVIVAVIYLVVWVGAVLVCWRYPLDEPVQSA